MAVPDRGSVAGRAGAVRELEHDLQELQPVVRARACGRGCWRRRSRSLISAGERPPTHPARASDGGQGLSVESKPGVTNPSVPIVANSQGAVFGLAAAAQGWAQNLVLASPADEVANPSVRALLPETARALPDLAQSKPNAARDLLYSFTPHAMRAMVLDGSDEQDRAVYTAPAFDALYQTALAEGFARAGSGYVADTIMAITRWPIDLAAITTPVAVLFGAGDQVHSPDRGTLVTTRLPNAQRAVISNAAGALLWTHSDLVFNTALQQPEALQQHAPAASPVCLAIASAIPLASRRTDRALRRPAVRKRVSERPLDRSSKYTRGPHHQPKSNIDSVSILS